MAAGDETFFATAAQVLPTIFIAIAVDVTATMRDDGVSLVKWYEEKNMDPGTETGRRPRKKSTSHFHERSRENEEIRPPGRRPKGKTIIFRNERYAQKIEMRPRRRWHHDRRLLALSGYTFAFGECACLLALMNTLGSEILQRIAFWSVAGSLATQISVLLATTTSHLKRNRRDVTKR